MDAWWCHIIQGAKQCMHSPYTAEREREWIGMKHEALSNGEGAAAARRCFLLFRNNMRCYFLALLSIEEIEDGIRKHGHPTLSQKIHSCNVYRVAT